MHAVVTTVRIADREKAGDRGASMAVYESEGNAKQAAERFVSPPAEIITIESMDVGEVVEQA